MREFTRIDRLAKISAIDAEARVVHSRSSINTRGSRKVCQSQLSFVPTNSCVFSLSLFCTLLNLLAIHGVLANLYKRIQVSLNILAQFPAHVANLLHTVTSNLVNGLRI